MDSMVGTAMTIEREMEDAWSARDASVSGKRKESQFLLVRESGRGLLVHKGSRAVAIRPGTDQGFQSG